MSAPAFTPGPWTTGVWKGAVSGSNQHYGDHAAVFAPSGDMVCPCGLPDDPDNIPNAHLIAAAPELYAELQQFVNGVETRMIDSPADETLANITHRARTALAKARGEQ